ncbi:MAG: hypothetical protein KDN22_34235 [Verrucomicrobiae bacterium]|nr:hypothetical protein [Verrucomicrobiae bacterium]
MIKGIYRQVCGLALISSFFASGIDAKADSRAWKSKFGSRTVEGEFVELKDGKLSLRKPGGGNLTLPISALTAEDQEFATQAQNAIDAQNRVDVSAALKDKMFRMVNGKAEPFALPAKNQPAYFLFYVVSSLCDTCVSHAPRLKEYYEKTLAPASEIELIVISLDTDKEQQQEYLAGQKLPFPAVSFESMAEFTTAVTPGVFNPEVDGCQTFILTTADGKVLAKSALEPKSAIEGILKH